MSLSFVSSAVLSSSDGVSHNEEKSIDNKETQAARSRGSAAGASSSLFEQLRANQEKADQDEADFQKSIVRGTLALTEEDAAHLDALQKQKQDQERHAKTSMEQELALFRAAKENRVIHQAETVDDIVGDDDDKEKEERQTTKQEGNDDTEPEKSCNQSRMIAKRKPLVPKIVAKRKRRQQQQQQPDDSFKKPKPTQPKTQEPSNSLGSLLGGYGSDDSSDD